MFACQAPSKRIPYAISIRYAGAMPQTYSAPVRIPADIYDRMRVAADRDDRSIQREIAVALREWLNIPRPAPVGLAGGVHAPSQEKVAPDADGR